MNTILPDFLHDLTRHEGLALLVSAQLTSAGIVCVAAAAATVLRHRSARARSLVWRLALTALLVTGVWKLAPDMSPPVAVMEWQVDWSAMPSVTPVLPMADLPPLVLPEKTRWEHACEALDGWAVRMWLGVAALWLLGRVAGVALGLRALKRRSSEATSAVRQIGEEIGLPPQTCYRMVESLGSPMLTGWRRPVIWLPSEAAAWDAARLDAVLRHEAAHWQRKDWLWQWLAQAALCLWWWQPLVWLARNRLRVETEHAADDLAVGGAGQAAEYARTLVEIAAGLPSRGKGGLGVTMLGQEGVKQRVQALLRANRWRGRIGFGALIALTAVTVALGLLVATKVEFAPQKPVYQSTAKLVIGGGLPPSPSVAWQEQMEDFYGSIIETAESAAMARTTSQRVHAVHPKLERHEVEIHVTKAKGSASFTLLASSDDPEYTKIYLDALLDEFIAFRQNVREQAQGKGLQAFLQEVINRQKVMEVKKDAVAKFQRDNNAVVSSAGHDNAVKAISTLQTQREDVRTQLAELKLALAAMPGSTERATETPRGFAPERPLSHMEQVYLQTKSELFVLNNERSFLLKSQKPDHPEVLAVDQKIAKLAHLLSSASTQIQEEMKSSVPALERKLAVLNEMIKEREAYVLAEGRKLADYEKLKSEAATAQEVYEKIFENVKAIQSNFNMSLDYVAIQERATSAKRLIQSGILPVWKLWRKDAASDAAKTAAR